MCSFGGKILPRPHDNQLRYVGGDTRIVSVPRHPSFSFLLNKLSKLSGTTDITVKYQLPNEDLDALITVTCDEDVENMMEEFDRLAHTHKTARLRLFLFPIDGVSRTNSISSLLDGSTKREHWFLDALNGGSSLERGRSEVSSIVSEVPDYLFGLDHPDDPPRESRLKTRALVNDNVSASDPGSPDPVITSPFCSTSSSLGPVNLPPIPDLRPVRVRPDNPTPVFEPKEAVVESVVDAGEERIDYTGQTWHYVRGSPYPMPAVQNMPIYIIPGSVPPRNVPVQSMPIRATYVQPFPPPPAQIPVSLNQQGPNIGQVYSGGVRPVDQYEISGRAGPGMNQQVYYGLRNVGAPGYSGMVVTGAEEMPGTGTGTEGVGRVP